MMGSVPPKPPPVILKVSGRLDPDSKQALLGEWYELNQDFHYSIGVELDPLVVGPVVHDWKFVTNLGHERTVYQSYASFVAKTGEEDVVERVGWIGWLFGWIL